MPERRMGVALLGHGVVGAGVASILSRHRELLARRTGLVFDVRHVVVRDVAKSRASGVAVSSDWGKAIADPAVNIVVELMGGTTTASEAVERALSLGKPVVTANKSLLALRGPELFSLAKKHNTCVAFEASCAGGIPLIQSLTQGLVANRIEALVGIVNGTCNFILTKMTRNRWGYAQALAEAQKAGFAEADPTMDVSGRDAAQKLALLASLAFNQRVTEADIHIEGIDTLETADIPFAGELGYVIKLLAIAQRAGDKISLRVHPTLVHQDDVLAEVNDSFNAVSVYGSEVGHTLFYGRGAGSMPTASAVVADMVSVGLGTAQLAFSQMNLLSGEAVSVLPFDELTSRYYLRLKARDEPGVMARVTQALGSHNISLKSVLQHEVSGSQHVPVVITTHRAREGDMRAALAEIDKLGAVLAPTPCLRIIDQPTEFDGR